MNLCEKSHLKDLKSRKGETDCRQRKIGNIFNKYENDDVSYLTQRDFCRRFSLALSHQRKLLLHPNDSLGADNLKLN